MSKCHICQRGVSFGHNVSHSKRRTKRSFKTNLSKAKILGKNFKICSRCLKRISYLNG